MFKIIFFLGAFGVSSFSLASDITSLDLYKASSNALVEASMEIDSDSIIAWEAKIDHGEVQVGVLNQESLNLTYGCHFHGQNMACHEEGHINGDKTYHANDAGFSFVEKASQKGLSKVVKVFNRKNISLENVLSYKVWSLESHSHVDDHASGSDVWLKVSYKKGTNVKSTFVVCHSHGSEEVFCHFQLKGQNEPAIKFVEDNHQH